MSVINQMLKDLDERSPDSNQQGVAFTQAQTALSTKKVILITSIAVLVVCFVSFYVWQLITENNALKAEQEKAIKVSQTKVELVQPRSSKPSAFNATENQNNLSKASEAPLMKLNQQPKKVYKAKITKPKNVSVNQNKDNSTEANLAKVIKDNNTTKVTPLKNKPVLTDKHSHDGELTAHSHGEQIKEKPKANKMSVSRREFSADELAEQKLVQAEKALAAKQVANAERLLEDAVILKPNDSQTRKKLAALWFGRQAYQDATNILSQGIALNGKDSSLREMKARIHIQQGQYTDALNTLKPLADLQNEQYQVLLANTAQQAQQNEIAVKAYNVLISIQPESGRWQMGLAVLYDKNSQFDLALKSYKQALTKNDLSLSSEDFVRQRIQVIGQ